MKKSHIPKIYSNKSFDDFNVKPENIQAMSFAMSAITSNQSLYIFGECGTGKTLLSSIIGREKALQEIQPLFFTSTDLFFELNPFTKEKEDKESTADKRFRIRHCSCLILDDLGAEKPSQWTNSILFDIVNYRYNEQLQTIFTSNFNVKDLQKRWAKENGAYEGARTGRRIVSMCKPVLLK